MKERDVKVMVTSKGHGEVHDGEGGHLPAKTVLLLPEGIVRSLEEQGFVTEAPDELKVTWWPGKSGVTLNEIRAQETGPMTGKPIEDDGGEAQVKAQQIIASQRGANIEPRDPLDREAAHSSEIGNGADDEDADEQEDAPQQRGGRNRGRNR